MKSGTQNQKTRINESDNLVADLLGHSTIFNTNQLLATDIDLEKSANNKEKCEGDLKLTDSNAEFDSDILQLKCSSTYQIENAIISGLDMTLEKCTTADSSEAISGPALDFKSKDNVYVTHSKTLDPYTSTFCHEKINYLALFLILGQFQVNF